MDYRSKLIRRAAALGVAGALVAAMAGCGAAPGAVPPEGSQPAAAQAIEVKVASAHRKPAEVHDWASGAHERGMRVIVAAAGKAAHLAGALAANTTLPVIGIPIKSSLDGIDALLSTVQMPSGVPVATVAIDGADNAALLAAQILSVEDGALAEKLQGLKEQMKQGAIDKDRALQTRKW